MKDEGKALRPDGRPEAVTETEELKPSEGVTDTCSVEEVPGAIEVEDGVTEMMKDGGGVWLEDPLPQPYRNNGRPPARASARHLAVNRP